MCEKEGEEEREREGKSIRLEERRREKNMALDAVVYPQDPFAYGCNKEVFAFVGGASGWGYEELGLQEEHNKPFVGSVDSKLGHAPYVTWDSSREFWDPNYSPEACTGDAHQMFDEMSSMRGTPPGTAAGRRKRRRTKSCKNKEELENQRMTHIAVERNRRKQMNEYLAVIRSLMPASYVQRGDQASIIGGAINYVKELEQLLQTLEAQKRATAQTKPNINGTFSPLFVDFFTFPQYSTRSAHCRNSSPAAAAGEPIAGENHPPPAMAEIEVTMAESHANIKVLSKRRPRQLLKMVTGLQYLRLTVLHLNVTSVDQMVLYSLSVKLEEGCQLTTVDEIADAINHLLGRIEEEATFELKP